MNIKEFIKLSINDKLYGGLWKDSGFRNMYINSFSKNNNRVMFGGDTDTKDVNSELGFTIKDTFVKYDTRSMLFGKQITPYYADVLVAVAKYYESQDITGNTELKKSIISYVHKIFKQSPNMNLNKLMSYFGAQTVECLLAYLLIAYQTSKLDLILRTTYTFGRVLPLKCKTEWFDNYRLNAYGNVLNMIMYKPYDRHGIYTIDESPKPINESVELTFYPKIIKFLVGSLRAFMILNDLTTEHKKPNSSNQQLDTDNDNNEVMLTGGNYDLPDFVKNNALSAYDVSIKENDFYSEEQTDGMSNDDNVISLLKGAGKYTDKEITDICYKQFPFFFGGAHGCDVFEMSNMSLSIDEITQFLQRYPSARIGYILNTATYRSGRGQHWVALELTKGKAKLVCSQQSDFDVFDDGGSLVASLKRNGYGMEHNERNIQTDDYACGTYAFISLMELLRFNDIRKAVDNIGVNMESLGKEIGKTSSADKVRQNLVGWLRGGSKHQ